MEQTPGGVWAQLPQPFLASEAVAAGLTSRSISGAVRRREIVPVAPSVFAVPQAWVALDPPALHRGLTRAAWLSVSGSVVSHHSAALLHRLPHPLGPIGVPTVTVPGSNRSSAAPDWKRVLHADLPDEHTCRIGELAVTTPARTVVDSLRQLRLRDALAMVDGALRSGLTNPADLQSMRRFQTRWPGIRAADVGLALADGRRESWLESASVATAHHLGFPVPLSQAWIHHLDGRLIGRVDLVWRGLGVIGEADGRGKYLGEFENAGWDAKRAVQTMLAERDRERALESVGFAVARWGTTDILRGGGRLEAALRAAARRADPSRIRCLWRLDRGQELREWVAAPPMTAA